MSEARITSSPTHHRSQFIRQSRESAQLCPTKWLIAHSFLTSLSPHLSTSIPNASPAAYCQRHQGVNYGFDKVRFVNAVKVNSAHPPAAQAR